MEAPTEVTITADMETKKANASPAEFHSPERDRVRFNNQTRGRVIVVVPNHPQANATIPAGSWRSLDFSSADNGSYVYAAYCEAVDAFAEGRSSPKVVIP